MERGLLQPWRRWRRRPGPSRPWPQPASTCGAGGREEGGGAGQEPRHRSEKQGTKVGIFKKSISLGNTITKLRHGPKTSVYSAICCARVAALVVFEKILISGVNIFVVF